MPVEHLHPLAALMVATAALVVLGRRRLQHLVHGDPGRRAIRRARRALLPAPQPECLLRADGVRPRRTLVVAGPIFASPTDAEQTPHLGGGAPVSRAAAPGAPACWGLA